MCLFWLPLPWEGLRGGTVRQQNIAESEAALPAIDTSHCPATAAGDPWIGPHSAVCEFALTYRRELPDFICEETTTTTGPKSTTALKAEVTFEKGHERYSNVTIDGGPPEANSSASASVVKFIAAGELGSDLVDLFKPPIVAVRLFHCAHVLFRLRSNWVERYASDHFLFVHIDEPEQTRAAQESSWVNRLSGNKMRIDRIATLP